ncbi:MAG: hypothetical protein HY321_19715 [Armatimonadetes bacterium]|nr:hypothetical protein [Armatimonadota bacterium]
MPAVKDGSEQDEGKEARKAQIIAEIRRVAEVLQTSSPTQSQLRANDRVSVSKVKVTFGSWRAAIEAAGLEANPQGIVPGSARPLCTDDELLQEIIRVTRDLGREPGAAETAKPPEQQHRRRAQFGEPIDFRGLRFGPLNEQGVVYLFGMVSRELGFLVESIRTEYPDCEAKRCVDSKGQRWEHALIEFEYRSRDFQDHGHRAEDCDLVVCWVHDWQECPVQVPELRSRLRYLSPR